MDCGDIERLIDAYLDRELTAAATDEVQAHLNECVACRRRYGPLVEMLTTPDVPAVPPGLREKVLAAVAEIPAATKGGRYMHRRDAGATPPAHIWRLQPAWIGALAACILLSFTSWTAWRLGYNHGKKSPTASEVPAPVVIRTSPGFLLSLAQLALPGTNPLPLVAQSAAIDRLLEPPDEACVILPRLVGQQAAPMEPPPNVPQMSILLSLPSLGV